MSVFSTDSADIVRSRRQAAAQGNSLETPRAFDGLTAQQWAYCRNRADGLTQLESYRQAYKTTAQNNSINQMANELERNPVIALKINAMVEADRPKTTLVPRVDRNFVLEGITAIATKESAKDNVRLRALELLGKVPEIGLFNQPDAPAKPRTIEELDRELKAALQAMADGAKVVEGQARTVEPAPAPTDRRRKPKT